MRSASRRWPTRASRPDSRDLDLLRRCSRAGRGSSSRRRSTPDHPCADHVRLHGDGVRDIAFQVDDADRGVRRGGEARRRSRPSSRTTCPTITGASGARPSTPTATRCTRSSPLERLSRAVPPRLRRAPRARARRRHPPHRSHRRQRRARARWTTGPTGTAACSASSATSASTTRTSRPSTARS